VDEADPVSEAAHVASSFTERRFRHVHRRAAFAPTPLVPSLELEGTTHRLYFLGGRSSVDRTCDIDVDSRADRLHLGAEPTL